MDLSENRGPQLLAVVITLLVTATVANAMRCYTRIGIVKGFGIDDWTMLIAYIFFTLFCACTIAGVRFGTGRHESTLPAIDRERARQFWWLCYIWYGWTMMFSKISIGVFILRVTINRYHTWTIWATIVSTIGGCGAFIMVTMFQCAPISAFWVDPQGAGRSSCLHGSVVRDLAYIYSAFTLLVDLVLVVLPLMIVWKLKMSFKSKIGLSVLIFFGIVASVGVAVRFAYLDDFTQPDFLFDTSDVAIWSSVESGLSVTAGSLATLRPLFRLWSRKLGLTACPVTKASSAEVGMPSPSLAVVAPPAAMAHDSGDVIAYPRSSSSGKASSRRDSVFGSGTPNSWQSKRYLDRASVTGDILREYELYPARPVSATPTLPRLSTGTWRFSREGWQDVERGGTGPSQG
ncbi:integral membrane protein [Apiospora arundinis]|uniref:Integral membrane protein n=1 Tax=Apiospora arundinis TaxID=335852 RepID=A0ABR2I2K1_9PEZI